MYGVFERRYGRERDPVRTLLAVLTSITRYDLVLGIIPAAFGLALVAGSALGLDAHEAFLGAALVGVLVLVDALYLNPPASSGSGRSA